MDICKEESALRFLNCQSIALLITGLALLGLVLKSAIFSDRIKFCAETFTESNKALQNPYCGFYHIICYTLSEDNEISFNLSETVNSYKNSLVLLEINLKNYRTAEISENGLSQLNDILSSWSKSPSGTKLILRFLYDWDGIAMATEPESFDLILKHIEQVSTYVNMYHDAVYIMQGAFVGNWGEMHHSEFSDLKHIKILMDKLNGVICPSVYLSVRTPSMWRAINNLYEPLPDTNNRLGLFNDGISGSVSDLGTYGNTLRKDAVSPAYSGTRDEELEFQNKLCRYVPNGGEVVYDENLSELDSCVSAFYKMHISYLNADYDKRVLEKWERSVWSKNDAFYGCDGYSYVKAHLGYRYVIDFCKLKKQSLINPDFSLEITIKNVGFSNSFKPFKLSVTLKNEETRECTLVPFDADLRSVMSGNKKSFTAKLPVKALSKGKYFVYLSATDKESGQTIFFGNTNEITKDGYLLGRLEK